MKKRINWKNEYDELQKLNAVVLQKANDLEKMTLDQAFTIKELEDRVNLKNEALHKEVQINRAFEDLIDKKNEKIENQRKEIKKLHQSKYFSLRKFYEKLFKKASRLLGQNSR